VVTISSSDTKEALELLSLSPCRNLSSQLSRGNVHEPSVEVVLRYFHRCRYRSSTVVVLLLEGALVSWLLAMREYGGHEDLRGLDHRSVIAYVHG
jgi:hypothetical protein